MTELSSENGMESESQTFLESLIQQLDDPAQQTMQAGLGKLLVSFLQRLDHQLNEVTSKLDSTMSRLAAAEEMLFVKASNIQPQHLKPVQVPKAQGASKTLPAPKAKEAPRVQIAPKAQVAPKAAVLAPKAHAKSPLAEDAPRIQAKQAAPKAKASVHALEQLAPKAKAPPPSVEQTAPKAKASSPSPDKNDQIVQCPDCEGLFAWSDYSEGDYAEGWGCNNGEAGCPHNAETDGKFRWFCPVCLNDFCGACGEIEAQALAMMEPGEPRTGKAGQDAANALMQEAEAIMKAELSPEEQAGPVNSKISRAPKAGTTAASLPNSLKCAQASEARDIAALLPDDEKLARARETGDIAALLPDDSQLASVQNKRGVVGTSAMALGAAGSKSAPMPKRVPAPPVSAQEPASPPAEVAVAEQAQGEEFVEEEEGEEEEEVVEDGTVEPEAGQLAVPTNTQAEVIEGTGQVAQDATAAMAEEEVIEEEEEEEEEHVEDETVEPGEVAPTLAAGATEPEEAEDAADSQLMAQVSQTVKRKARAGLVASTPGKRPRLAT